MMSKVHSLLLSVIAVLGTVHAQTYEFDNIESCTMVSQNPYEITFDVRYYYSGKDRRPAFLGVDGYEGETVCDYLSCEPVRLRKGRGTARVSLALNERASRRYETSKVSFFLYHQGRSAFEREDLIVRRQWSRGRPTPQPADPFNEYSVILPDVTIMAMRDGSGISIWSGKTLLTNGQEWNYNGIRRGVFTISRKSWRKSNWIVDLNEGQAYRVHAHFRNFLQSRKPLPFRVRGTRDRCYISLGQGRLTYNIKNDAYRLEAGGYELSNCVNWEAHCVRPDYYTFRNKTWKNEFWAADLGRKRVFYSRGKNMKKASRQFAGLNHSLEVN